MNAQDSNWDDFRVAWMVARHGSLSAAAEVLGIHHATVLRRVAALEERLGTRLFQRHARGATPTDAGRMLMQVVTATAEQFDVLCDRVADPGTSISGRLIVTTLAELADGLVDVLARFRADHPETQIELLADSRRLRLEYGEAHVAIRPGAAPREPDNIARPLGHLGVTLFAHRDYIARFGRPAARGDIAGHRYVSLIDVDRRARPLAWIEANVPAEQIVFRGGATTTLRRAVEAGMGLAPMVRWERGDGGDDDLVPLFPPPDDWIVPLWLVTHRDNHRSPKVQAIHRHLMAELPAMTMEAGAAG